MIRRLLLAGLLLVPLACGDGDGDAEGDAPAGGDGLEVSLEVAEPLRPGPVTWVVGLRNGSDEPVELAFRDGRRADVVLRLDGEEVYRWSRSRMFTQELGEEVVPAGGSTEWELEDVLEVDEGEYEVEAVVVATSRRDLRTTRQVTVEAR